MSEDNQASTYPKGIPQIHQLIKEIITTIIRNKPGAANLSVLDAAAGNGYLTSWMTGQDLAVTAIDIDAEQWAVPGVDCLVHDLNDDLPLGDKTFDLVVSVETIEHLENPYHILREFARVLKPTGHLIVSTPNVHSFRSRIKTLILGLPCLFEFVKHDGLGQHISPVTIGHFLYSFDQNDTAIENVYTTGPHQPIWRKVIQKVLDFPCLQFLRVIKSRHSHHSDHYIYRLTSSQLKTLMSDLILVVVARKNSERIGK